MAEGAKPDAEWRYWGCLAFSAIFLAYVGVGYYHGLGATEALRPVRLVALPVLVVVVLLIVMHAAVAWNRLQPFTPLRLVKWLGLYLLLFGFSGLGFVLATMFLVEGRAEVQKTVRASINAISDLQSSANRLLPVPEFDAKVGRLRNEKDALHDEISNPAACGWGSMAQATWDNIVKDLPDIQPYANTQRPLNCRIKAQETLAEQNADRYSKLLDTNIQNLKNTQYASYHIDDRAALKGEFKQVLDPDLADLQVLDEELDDSHVFATSPSVYDQSIATLHKVASDYALECEKLRALVPAQEVSNLPQRLNIATSEQIASPSYVINNVVSRWPLPLYALVAFIFDFGSVWLWASTIRGIAVSAGAGSADDRYYNGVRYLWKPQAPPA